MATKVVIDFDCNLATGQSTAPTSWQNTAKPVGVYQIAGVLTLNPNIDSVDFNSVPIGVAAGRHSASNAYGRLGYVQYVDTNIKSQIGLLRSTYSIGNEVFVTFDVKYSIPATLSSGGYQGIYTAIFRWGDVTVGVKSCAYTSPTYTVVYYVQKAGVEVATVTITDTTTSVWHYCKIHVKLDATTGLIDVNIDGHAQSVAYTGQNTVSTIALASTGSTSTADFIYFGPPVIFDNGGSGNVGLIDNVGVFDTSFPAGRLNARRWTMGTTSIDSNFAAVGTGATTIPDALLLPDDAKAARGTGIGANTLITMATGFDFTGLLTDLIGVNVYLKRPAQLDAFGANRHIAIGLSRSGVHTMEPVVVTQPLHVDNVITPPNQNYTFGGLGAGVFESTLTQANFDSTAIRLLVS